MSKLLSNLIKFLPALSLSQFQNNSLSDSFHSNQEIQTSIERLYLSPLQFSLAQFKVFELDTGQLGKQVAAHLDVTLGVLSSEKFNDGECDIQILDSVRGHNVFLIKSFSQNKINDGIIQLLIAVNTLKKQGAEQVTCILPFFPYSQSVDFHLEEQKTFFTCFGSDILKLLEDSGCNRVIKFNSLMSYPKGFVNQCIFININAPDLFVGHLSTKKLKDPILVSTYINTPNANNLHILKEAFKKINFDCPISTFNQNEYIGVKVENRDVILYSNITRFGNTFIKQSRQLKQMGANNIYGCAFHSLAGQNEVKHLMKESELNQLITTNSLPHSKSCQKVKIVSLARLIAETITLFEGQQSLNQFRTQAEVKKMKGIKEVKTQNKYFSNDIHTSNSKAEQVI